MPTIFHPLPDLTGSPSATALLWLQQIVADCRVHHFSTDKLMRDRAFHHVRLFRVRGAAADLITPGRVHSGALSGTFALGHT